MADGQKVTINNKDYLLDALNETAKNQLMNIRVTDQKIAALQQDLSLFQTARATYAQILAAQLPKDS